MKSAASSRKPTVAIIGAGVFGVTAALELSKAYDVDLFERAENIFTGATFANHNRHHLGFHYPRSAETSRQCIDSAEDFKRTYGSALISDFSNYYCIGKDSSKVSPEEYRKFCQEMGLEFIEEAAPEHWINRKKIDLCLKVKESVCDFFSLRSLAYEHLRAKPEIRVHLGHSVVGGEMGNQNRKVLRVQAGGKQFEREFDFVVSAIYANYNLFCDWFHFEKRPFQFNLQELDLVELPESVRFGCTIMDGSFPSILPYGKTGLHIMAHVDASQLVRESSFSSIPLMNRVLNIESNWSEVQKVSREFIPIVESAQYKKSIFVDRVVDASRSLTDSRITELSDHGSGCYSIFAAKVITCVSTAKKLHALMQAAG